MTNEEALSVLNDAVNLGETILIVRNGDSVAEVMGQQHRYNVHNGTVTIGQDGGSHVHLNAGEVAGFRYTEEFRGKRSNAALLVLGPDERVILKVSFRKTNPAYASDYNEGYADLVRQRLSQYGVEQVAS